HLRLQSIELHDAALSRLVEKGDLVVPDVDADNLRRPLSGTHHLPLSREPLARSEIGVVLVGEAAHQAPARSGDLRRVERKVLVLGELKRNRLYLAEPGRAAKL